MTSKRKSTEREGERERIQKKTSTNKILKNKLQKYPSKHEVKKKNKENSTKR